MTLGISGAAWAGMAVAGSSLYGANQAAKGASRAAGAQSRSAQAGIDEQRRQYEAMQKLMSPYVEAGSSALAGQRDLLGLSGQQAQEAAISGIQSSPQFAALNQQGQNAILQNASATGGLRGGNTQAALAQFSPQLLSQLINQQYSQLGGMATAGQNAAAGVGTAGMNTGTNIGNLLGQQGAAQAGGYLAAGKAQAGMANALTAGLGMYSGMGGNFGGAGGAGGAGAGGAGETPFWTNGSPFATNNTRFTF